jgi:glycogen operon protein
MHWEASEADEQLLAFTKQLIQLRREHPVLRRRTFFQGRPIHGAGVRDIAWLQPDGSEMTDAQWVSGHVRALGMWLNGVAIDEVDARGEPITDDLLLLLINGHATVQPFRVPGDRTAPPWEVLLDTHRPQQTTTRTVRAGAIIRLPPRTLVVLRLPQ